MKWISLILIVFLVGCAAQEEIMQETVEPMEEPADDNSEVIDLCNSHCNVNQEAYCVDERDIMVGSVEVKGTCRAFARKENVAGFDKCPGFCKGLTFVDCTVNGETDQNCDGI